jgi:hypothetical protein
MSVSTDLLNKIDELVVISNERCSEELQCRHCYASQCLSDLYRLVEDWLDTIKTDCGKKE